MLTKTKFTRTLNAFIRKNEYTPSDVLVTHGGAMVQMKLCQTTADIDVHVSRDIWVDQILKSENTPVSLGGGVWMLSVTDVIDIHIGAAYPTIVPEVHPSGFLYNHREQTLQDYLKLNRPKDQETIKRLLEL